MSETAPSIYSKGFRPNISHRLSQDDLATMSQWGMSPVGVPVPTYHNAKAAIWYGQSHDLAEIPVVSLVTPRSIRCRGAQWFIGLTEHFPHMDHQEQLHHYAEAAQFISPNGLYAAISGLRQLMGDREAVFNSAPEA